MNSSGKPLIVIGKMMAIQHQSVAVELSNNYDVVVIDLLEIGRAMKRLRGREVEAAILKMQTFTYFMPLLRSLAPTGTRLNHCIGRGPLVRDLPESIRHQVGFCGYLDLNLPLSTTVDQTMQICDSCNGEAHGAWSPTSLQHFHADLDHDRRLDEFDNQVVFLISRGFTDQQISHALNFSVQTIRNRVSHILKTYGFENRTELSWAQIQAALAQGIAVRGIFDEPEPL